nr:nicalin-1 [Tanacetum cinerariifolium]
MEVIGIKADKLIPLELVSKPPENAYVKQILEGENGLWLHVSKPPGNAYVKQIFEGLSNVAEELGVTVGLKHKKINVSNSREHEQFSRLRVTAATLDIQLHRIYWKVLEVFLITEFVNEAAVVKSVKVVAESLPRHIYGQQAKTINILADNSSLAVNPSYIR